MKKIVVEFKNNKVIVDGIEKGFSEIGLDKNHHLDLTKFVPEKLFKGGIIVFVNRSIKNVFIIGVNDWMCKLKNRQEILSLNGVMRYMSQTNI